MSEAASVKFEFERAKLQELLGVRQMLENFRSTEEQSERVTMDSFYMQVVRSDYETLIDLAIEGLRYRLCQEGYEGR